MSSWPLVELVLTLDGFEFAVFLLTSIVTFFAIGFGVDFILGRRGMGPYFNSIFAMIGGYAGLCAHDWWLSSYSAYEPHLTVVMVVGGLLTALLGATTLLLRWT
jgi:ABC-type branched-subunit amino acid transport system permease subunit